MFASPGAARCRWLCAPLVALGLCAVALATWAPTASARGQARIINGAEVTAGDYAARWQFIVALVSASQPDASQGQVCGGSLIEPTVVLTAAHCVIDGDTGDIIAPDRIDVVTGRRDLTTAEGQRIHAAAVIPNPSHDPVTNANDLALIVLQSASTATKISLALEGESALWGGGAGVPIGTPQQGPWVAGWGNRDASATGATFPPQLFEVQVPIISDTACATPPAGPSGFSSPAMMCGSVLDTDGNDTDGATNGRDTCQGDSGGPLIVGDGAGGWRLAGITSWGYGCASTTYGVYTRIDTYRTWISQCLADTTACRMTLWVGSPTNMRVDRVTVNSIKLSWSAPIVGAAPAGYKVYALNSRGQRVLFATTRTPGGTLRDLYSGRTYRLVITGYNGIGESTGTAVTARTRRDLRNPTRPGPPRVTRQGRTSLRLAWKASRDNDSVKLYRVFLATGSRWKAVRTVPGNGHRALVRGLGPGSTYRMRVVAYDWVGRESRPSAARSLATKR